MRACKDKSHLGYFFRKKSHVYGSFTVFTKRLYVLSKGILQFLGFFKKIVKTHNLNKKITSLSKSF